MAKKVIPKCFQDPLGKPGNTGVSLKHPVHHGDQDKLSPKGQRSNSTLPAPSTRLRPP